MTKLRVLVLCFCYFTVAFGHGHPLVNTKASRKAGFYKYKVSQPSLPLSFSLQFLASSTTVQFASWCTCSRVIKLFHRNAPYMQHLIPPKHYHLLAHIHTRLLHLVGLKLLCKSGFRIVGLCLLVVTVELCPA